MHTLMVDLLIGNLPLVHYMKL